MASNPPPPGPQAHWPPPTSGSMAPQSFAASYPMQFRPAGAPPQGQQYTSPQVNQQYHPAGQPQNIGMIPGQNQQPPFSQPVQQYHPRPGQLGHGAPSPYPQMHMSLAPSTGQPQPGAPSNGVTFSSSYTFAPSSYGMPQNNVNMPPQFQHLPQPVGSAGGQPWLQPSQPTAVVAPPQQGFPSATPVPAVNGSSTTQQAATDWQEYEATDGRRYYYNKVTKQSSWEKPPELMTPLEMSWHFGNMRTALYSL